MKYSIVSACVASLLVAVVAVQASYYSPRHSNYPANHGLVNQHGPGLAGAGHYSGAGLARGCTGYNCNSGAYRHLSANGPYHSYAVRPAIYGGHGLYGYRGYARYPAASSHSHYRQVRSCSGYNCNRGAYGSSPSLLGHSLRPIKALVVNPVYRPTSYHHANRHSVSASGYGRGPYSSSYSGSHNARRHPLSGGY